MNQDPDWIARRLIPLSMARPCDALSPPPDYDLDFETTDFRQHPELYRVGRGEQGVLLVQPYKSEILPHWRFRTPQIAQESADAATA